MRLNLENISEQENNIFVSPNLNDVEIKSVSGDDLPFLPLKNVVLFPNVVFGINVTRQTADNLIHEAYRKGLEIVAATQIYNTIDMPDIKDIYKIGTVARVLKILSMPDGSTSAILQGKRRAEITQIIQNEYYPYAKIEVLDDIVPQKNDKNFVALIEAVRDAALHYDSLSHGTPYSEMALVVRNHENPVALINYISANFALKVENKAELLAIDNVSERGFKLVSFLAKESQVLDIKSDIQLKVKKEFDRQNREFFLHQQIKTIQDELGGSSASHDVEQIKEIAKTKKWNETVKNIFKKEIEKLERMNPHAPDFPTQQNYVETIVSLPWNEFSEDNLNMKRAKKVLDKEHFGLEKVKERIIEHLAVLKLRKDLKAPIICLFGPPGVGKTSLGKSIAEVLQRKYVRASLGGLHDEAEIRGHRRTYIGSMCGRIINGIKKAGTSNPVFVLDEIDKLNNDFRGDPASALLEVLDPEQNNAFHDNYLDIDYDLSKVLFIATANSVSSISQPLLDRMELIEVNGYIPEEKLEIATKYLIPKQLEFHGIEPSKLKFSRAAIRKIIDSYTKESGVRELDRTVAKILRKVATKIAIDADYPKIIEPKHLKEFLGIEKFEHESFHGQKIIGVVTGLAWTRFGGEILFIETSLNKTKGGKLSITGNVGDVMKESATLALEYIKSHANKLNISDKMLEKHSVHIHVPEGAIPKDGPSAGVAIFTALVSSFTEREVKKYFAMTGEITLRGKVLPVGGIKEKILAAKRAGITDIILCNDNKKDIEEIQNIYLKGLRFHFIANMHEALDLALEKK
jgi:ATP-dependent Lon protease